MNAKLLAAIVFLFSSSVIFSQVPNYMWAKSVGGTSSDFAETATSDADGNMIIAGPLTGSVTFGTTTLTSAGTYDMFVAKYDSSGNVLWAKRAGGGSSDVSTGVCTDAAGNVFVTGFFSGPSITFGSVTLTNAGLTDMFVVKYDPAGNVLWAKSAGGTSDDSGVRISADRTSGDVVITGGFWSPTLTFGTTNLTNGGSNFSDVFIVRYSAAGNVLWAKSAGGNGYDEGHDVSMDANGNALLTGYFLSTTIKFGTTTLTNASSSTNSSDIFLVKYNSSGTVLWAKRAGGIDNEDASAITTDAKGNVLLTGPFSGASLSFGTTTITNADGNFDDIFLAKYDSSGNVIWARRAGGLQDDVVRDVCVNASGNILITGAFHSPSVTFGTTVLTNTGGGDMFIAKYDAAGNIVWAQGAGGGNFDIGYSIVSDPRGYALLMGCFGSSSITFGTNTLTNAGTATTNDIFITKLETSLGLSTKFLNLAATASSPSVQVFSNQSWTATEAETWLSIDTSGGYGNGVINISVTANPTSTKRTANITFGAGVDTLMLTIVQDSIPAPPDSLTLDQDTILASSSVNNTTVQLSSNRSWTVTNGAGWITITPMSGINDAVLSISTLVNSGSMARTADILVTAGTVTRQIHVRQDGLVGMNELQASFDVDVYPNPSAGQVSVESPINVLKIEVMNMLGDKVYSNIPGPIQSAPLSIDLSAYSRGIYFIHLSTARGTVLKKISITGREGQR